MSHLRSTSRRRFRHALAAAAPALLLAGGCARDAHPDADWPAGLLMSADREALLRVLAQLERLEHTPLARAAGELARALPACEQVEAHAEDGAAALASALRCADPAGPLRDLHAWRGADAAALALPVSAGPRVLLRVREEPEGLAVSLRWPRPHAGSLAASLLPGADPAGAAVLAAADRVAHARVRSDGLDLAALVAEGSQADDLFRLKSDLLSAALLDGTWELAVYLPVEGARMPRIAVALGVRLRTAAQAALDRLLTDVEASWPVRRAPLPVAGLPALCLPDLALLPELAPCGVATERALVLAWNAASLRHALAAQPGAVSAAAAAGRAVIDLERLREADLRLAARGDGAARVAAQRWPWRRLVAHGDRRGDAVALELRLESAPGGREW